MTYSARELSADQGRPIELYQFKRETQEWRFTSTDAPIVYESQTYDPAVIDRGTIEQGSEMNRTSLTLTVPRDFPIVELYLAGPPSDVITLILRQLHVDDGEARLLWSGRIITVTTWDQGKGSIVLEPVYTSLRRNGLRRVYQRQCPHLLYGPECAVPAVARGVNGTVAQVSGSVITFPAVAGYLAQYFAGGYIEWQISSGIFERRFIESHNDASLTCTVPPLGLTNGTAATAYPGCNHQLSTCANKFNNAANYGGMPYIPTQNPFDGSSVY